MTGPQEAGAGDGVQAHIVAALERLPAEDWVTTPIPGAVTSMREWSNGSVDTVILLSTETSYGHRKNGRGDTVWAMKGTLGEVINAALTLKPPLSPDAPSEPIPERTDPDM